MLSEGHAAACPYFPLGAGFGERVYKEAMAQKSILKVLTHLRTLNKKAGLLINFDVVWLKDGIKRLILLRSQREKL